MLEDDAPSETAFSCFYRRVVGAWLPLARLPGDGSGPRPDSRNVNEVADMMVTYRAEYGVDFRRWTAGDRRIRLGRATQPSAEERAAIREAVRAEAPVCLPTAPSVVISGDEAAVGGESGRSPESTDDKELERVAAASPNEGMRTAMKLRQWPRHLFERDASLLAPSPSIVSYRVSHASKITPAVAEALAAAMRAGDISGLRITLLRLQAPEDAEPLGDPAYVIELRVAAPA